MSHPKSNIYDNQSIDFIEALKHQSRIQDIDQSGIIIHNYKKEKYPFSDIIIKLLLFDSRCIHASTLNKSNFTRVSMDVRVIPKNDYLNLPIKYQGTGRMQSNFAPGDYYHEHALNAR